MRRAKKHKNLSSARHDDQIGFRFRSQDRQRPGAGHRDGAAAIVHRAVAAQRQRPSSLHRDGAAVGEAGGVVDGQRDACAGHLQRRAAVVGDAGGGVNGVAADGGLEQPGMAVKVGQSADC